MIKVRETNVFVVMKLPKDRTLAPKHVVVGTYHELCYCILQSVFAVYCIEYKRMDGLKNKMLSQIRALSTNTAWSLRYLFSHARCFCLSFQRWYVLKPSWIRQIAFSLSVVGRCKIPDIKPGQVVKPDGRDFVVVWRKRFRVGQAFRSVSQPRWDFTRMLPTLPGEYCNPSATVVHIVHLQTPRLHYVSCGICQILLIPPV